MQKSIIFLFIVFSRQFLFSQNNIDFTNFDSCLVIVSKLKESDLNKALVYINKCINISEHTLLKEKLAEQYYAKAKIFDQQYLYDSSYVYYCKAAPLFMKNNKLVNAAKCYINIGVTDYYYGDVDKALKNYQIVLHLLENTQQYELLAKTHNNIAIINKSQGFYKQAIKYFHHSLDLHEKAHNSNGIAACYQNIGVIYLEQKNYRLALNYMSKAAQTYNEYNNINDLAGVFTNIGLIYNNMNDTAAALSYYGQAINLYTQIDYKDGIATVNLNKAEILFKAGFYNDAELLTLQALEIFNKTGYKTGAFNCNMQLSRIYSVKRQHQKAINLAHKALNLNNANQSLKHLVIGYNILSQNYQAIGNYSKAYYYLKKYTEINDSIFSLEKNKQINELQTKYETAKKENKIIILQKNEKIKNIEIAHKDRRIKLISIILLIIVLFTIIIVILYLQKRKLYIALVKQNVIIAKKESSNVNIDKAVLKQSIEGFQDNQLNEEQYEELIKGINYLMEEKKFFKNKQFTIRDFAKELNTNRNYVSQIINEYFQTNFNNFVNEYRVKEARKLLISQENNQYTIEAIGNMVGFHSKATFNNSFKKFTGVTPSFFRKNI